MCLSFPMETKYRGDYNARTTSRSRCLLQGKFNERKIKHIVTKKQKAKQNPTRETMFLVWGRGGGRGGVVVGEHVRGEAGFRVCDILA